MQTLKPFLRFIASGHEFTNHFHTKACDCRFLYVLKGSCKLHTEHEIFEVLPNSLLYYPCGISYFLESTSEDTDLEYITVNFDFTFDYSHIKDCLHPIKSELFNSKKLLPSHQQIENPIFNQPFVITDIPYIKEDLLRLTKTFHQVNPYTQDICSSILSTIIYYILYSFEQKSAPNALIENVKKYIDSHYSEDITYSILAHKFNYHPYYVNTVFKQLTGDTLHKYLMKHRINRSQELLISTNLSIYQIAITCGFNNQAHFSTYFKKLNHTTPQNFRKKHGLV
jgi:AraC-like DNA-binding protein